MFSKKATKFYKIFTVDLTSCSKCQIDSEDFVNFCGLLRKHELYVKSIAAYAPTFLRYNNSILAIVSGDSKAIAIARNLAITTAHSCIL